MGNFQIVFNSHYIAKNNIFSTLPAGCLIFYYKIYFDNLTVAARFFPSPLLVLHSRTSDGSTNKHAAHTHRGGLKIPNLFRFSRKTSHWSTCNLPVACKAPPSLDCCECNPFVQAGRLTIVVNLRSFAEWR